MADREEDDWAKHIGGFKRPPPWRQFQKGQSGNPKGRPKGTGKKQMEAKAAAKRLTGSEEILDKLTEEQIELSRSGKKVRMTKKEALRHAQISLAIKGNPLAMRDINRDIAQLEAKKEAIGRAEAEAAEQAAEEKAKRDDTWFEYLIEFKDKRAKAWEDAEAEGKDEPDEPWPHPDDILIDHAKRTAWIRGPWGDEDVPYFEYLEAQRDLMFLRDMIHLKTSKLSEITDMSFWERMWRLLDAKLPLDWQIAHKADRYELSCLNTPLRTLRRKADEISRLVDELEPSEFKVRDKATYKFVNAVMKPLLVKLGYRSVAHFERVTGQQMTGNTSRT
jgi:hypothetical protein